MLLVCAFTTLYVFIMILECALSCYKNNVCYKTVRSLVQQQPHTSHVYLSFDYIIFSWLDLTTGCFAQ